ncbi:MAG: hypothetical protein ABIN67_21025 [Ferruginibacter sp.]
MAAIVSILLWIIFIYLCCGMVFAIVLLASGIGKIVEGAQDSSLGFKVLVIPGIIVFWPALLQKWIKLQSGKTVKIDHKKPDRI